MTGSEFEQITDRFVEWLDTVGIEVSKKVKIADSRSDHQGRCMVCVEDVKEGDRLFSVPNEALLNVTTGLLAQVSSEIKEALVSKIEHWEGLILTILFEWKYQGEKSKWWPYLRVLPEEFDTLIYWSEGELGHLRPSLVVERLGIEESKAMYERVGALMREFKVDDKIGEVSYEEFQRVASWIMAYSFDKDISGDDDEEEGNEEEEEEQEGNEDEDEDEVPNSISSDGSIKCMIAVADILNSDTNLVNANIIYDDSGLICCATKDIKAGEQVYNIYGNHPNAEILRRYGYVEWNGSKYDFGEVTLDNILTTLSEKYSTSRDILDKAVNILKADEKVQELWDFEDVVLDNFDCYADGEIIPEAVSVIQVLYVLLQSPENLAQLDEGSLARLLQRIVKKCQQLLESGRVTQSVNDIWQLVVDKRLQMYPESKTDQLSEDNIKAAFSKSKSEQRKLMAWCVLEGERKALANCRDGVTKQFKLIDDEKLLKNVLKRPAETEAAGNSKRKSRIVKRPKKRANND